MAISKAKAIVAKCKGCGHDDCAPGTWRQQIAQCPVITCELWLLRPMPKDGPYSGSPRRIEDATQEWRKEPIGSAKNASFGMGVEKPMGEAA